MIKGMSNRGAVVVGLALMVPILLLIVAGLILGIAQIEAVRLERVAGDAALLTQPDAKALIESADGRLVCWWEGSGPGHCFDDGLDMERTQVVAVGRTWHYPAGSVTPTQRVTRPKEVPDVEE